MEHLLALIQKFKDGNASESEKDTILEMLSVNEQELKDFLEKGYKADITNATKLISENRSAEIFNSIQQAKIIHPVTAEEPKGKVIPISNNLVRWLVAACFIGIIVSAVWYATKQNPDNKSLVTVTVRQQLQQFSNTTHKSIETVLQDGTTVSVEPNSAISYYEPFLNSRDISLTGKATFKVAKDASRPFTVYANGISTTALGTEFSVDAFNDNVQVRLLEGKVVVRPVNKNIAMATTYLKPGEECIINQHKGTCRVSGFVQPNNVNSTTAEKSIPDKQESKSRYVLTFNKTPLTEVFNKISNHYKNIIHFNKNDFGNASFTGSFLSTDSLQIMLTVICNTNDLSYKEENGVIVISK